MKSKLQKGFECSFPKLMLNIEKGFVVLMKTEYGEGFVVNSEDDSFPVGYTTNAWSMKKFIDFNGKIVLSN